MFNSFYDFSNPIIEVRIVPCNSETDLKASKSKLDIEICFTSLTKCSIIFIQYTSNLDIGRMIFMFIIYVTIDKPTHTVDTLSIYS